MHRFSTLLALSLLLAGLRAQATVVSPNDRSELEGSTFTHLPLGRHDARMQTLHLDVPGGTVISGHGYRREAAGLYGPVGGFSTEIEVAVSMSPNPPDQASSTFAQNVGGNPVVVLPRTLLAFPGTTRPPLDPASTFELVVPYQTPFVVPAGGGTVCVDITIYGNLAPTGPDRNFSAYLDGHRHYPSGDSEQPGYRFGSGCSAPGQNQPTTGNLSLWHLGSAMEIDLSVRRGVLEDGSGLTRAWLALGLSPSQQIWPPRPECPLFGSNDVWFAMPGTMTTQGRYDGLLTPLPVLPPGFRIWAQAGSIHLGTGELSFGNGITVMTPPPGPLPIPTARIVSSSDRTAITGAVSFAVPVMLFF